MTTTTVADQVERVLKPIQQFVRGWMTGPLTDRLAVDLGHAIRRGPVDRRARRRARETAMRMSPQPVSPFSHPSVSATHGNRCRRVSPTGRSPMPMPLCVAGGVRPSWPSSTKRAWRGSTSWAGASPTPPIASIGTVFAGWRAQPQPDDVNGRVALTMHVLREMRGGAHIIAVNACGITPLDAVLASPAPAPRSGPVWAEHLGWTGPFTDPEASREARAEAERVTSRIIAPIYGSIGDSALDEFAELVETTRNAIDM